MHVHSCSNTHTSVFDWSTITGQRRVGAPSAPEEHTLLLLLHTCTQLLIVHLIQTQVDAELVHPSAPEEFTLTVPKLEVKPGQVCAIVGKVGGGERCVCVCANFICVH